MSKNVLVIGATSGLGRQLAALYASDGWQVGIAGRREHLLESLAASFPGNIHSMKLDVKEKYSGERIAELIGIMGGIDLIIICASVVELNASLDPDPEMDTIGINVAGYTKAIHAAWHYFLQKGSGHIAGITSIAAARGNKNAPAYHASKSFQSAYLESLRVKAKADRNNITVTEIIPGYIDTDMGKGDRVLWMVSVEKAARLARKAITRKKARAFVPAKWWFVYHIQRVLPIFIYDWLMNGSWKLKRKT